MAWVQPPAQHLDADDVAVGQVYLETRLNNLAARAFYRRLGYHEVQTVKGYYQGVESGMRMGKDLWLAGRADADFT